MSQSASVAARGDFRIRHIYGSIDFVIAIAFIALFAVVVYAFEYRGAFAESDLYRVLVGLLDGAVSGTRLASDLHYDLDFGFGYLAAFYAFADAATLRDPDRLTALMNEVGYCSILVTLLCFWGAVRMVHGARAATVALIIFALSPMVPELATSGHQVVPMFGFLCAAAILLFLPVTGWRALLATVAASALLLAGLLTRGEIFLAFPWLVLSRIDTRSLRAFIVSGFVRSIAPATTLVVFFLLRHQFVNTSLESSVDHYFGTFYAWATVAPGLVYMAVGCGIATAAIGLVAAIWLIWRAWRGVSPQADVTPAALLGPIALVLVPLAFFAPNPQPTRHFMMTLAGLSILIAIVLTVWPAISRVVALVIAFAIGAANQVLAEAVRPALMRINDAQSPYIPVQAAYRTTTHANLGWEWQRHAALVERRADWHAMGEMIRTSCDDFTFIFSDEGEQLFSRLYAGGVPVQAHRVKIGPFYGLSGVRHGRTFIILAKMNGWPVDATALILADPAYAKYRLFADPYTMSKYDRTPIPAERAATFGCPDKAIP